MRRLWHIWAAFGLALALALGGMAWVSVAALRLDRAEAAARRQAQQEENVRLALWRMDSAMTPLVATESGHPYFAYTAFYPAERAYTRMFAEIRQGEILIPSPLLAPASPRVLLYFQFGPDGALTSPQVPTGNMRDLAEGGGYVTRDAVEEAAGRMGDLRQIIGRDVLLAQLPVPAARPAAAPGQGEVWLWGQTADQVQREQEEPGQQGAAQQRASLDVRARFQRAQELFTANLPSRTAPKGVTKREATAAGGVLEGVMRPVWVDSALLLARRVRVGTQEYVQGCWLDWPAIRQELLQEAAPLLPEAALESVRGEADGRGSRMLATLPVRLVPGRVPAEAGRPWSPIRIALVIAWGCVLVAAAAVGGLFLGAVRLSERRGTFVSAVTHELRTPLTTFRMYAEMLADGMVRDAAKRHRYLETLRGEADRLSHLVENVLAYARLERGRARGQAEPIPTGDLLRRVGDRLRDRAQRGGLQLDVEADEEARQATVRADPSVVEQILLNLVDNACKYAAAGSDRRVHLRAERQAGRLLLRVSDHGPGVSEDVQGKLFRPFSKSAQDAARSAPGIGLGLALSRRMARDLGGDLWHESGEDGGACFVLALPLHLS